MACALLTPACEEVKNLRRRVRPPTWADGSLFDAKVHYERVHYQKTHSSEKKIADSGIWFNGLDSAKGKPSKAWRAQRKIYCLHDRQN